MGSAIASWIASEGIGLLLGALARVLLDYIESSRAAKAQRDAGQLETERDQAREGERVNAELADEAAKRIDHDDAIARLERGDA